MVSARNTATKVRAARPVPDVHIMNESSLRFLRSPVFWAWSIPTLAVLSLFFGWELQVVRLPIPTLPRVPATTLELAYTGTLIILLSLSTGLFGWRRANGTCPIGIKRTASAAGILGGIALLCPVCLVLPASLIGISIFFTIIAQFLPLIRLIAMLLALFSVSLLWPKRG